MNANLPALILVAVLLFTWQAAAMGIDAAYILPSPVQVVVRLWELRGPLFTAHLPATMSVVAIGLLISIVLGVGLAVLMDASETARKGAVSADHRLADDPDDGAGTAVCALVRLHDLEQGAGNGADYVFPYHDHGI